MAKKEIKNIQRISNILSGNVTSKSKTSVGYSKIEEERKEGDVWEEGDKTWTIKNGILKTVSKLSKIRSYTKLPFACQCGQSLKHHLDKTAYRQKGECYTCLLKEETKYRLNGTWEEYASDKRKENVKSWMEDAEIEYKDQLDQLGTESFVTEDGTIEDWGYVDKKSIKDKQDSELNMAREIINEENKNGKNKK